MVDRPDDPVPAAVQSDLQHPPCSPLNPAAEGKNGESKDTSACHAQDQSARIDQAAKNIYAAQAACVQISEPVVAGLLNNANPIDSG